MFKFLFVPKAEWQEKINGPRKLDHLLFDCVADVFHGQHRGGGTKIFPSGAIEVRIDGVSPTNDNSTETITQMVASNMTLYNFDKFFYIRSVETALEAGSALIDPSMMHHPHYPKLMMEAFHCDSIPIPKRFICPITSEIINRPVFLQSNPKIFYEKDALLKWVIQNNTDPITRENIATPGITDALDFRREIYRFVFDAASGKNLSIYYAKEDGDQATADPTTEAQVENNHINSSARFFSKTPTIAKTKDLSEVFFSLKLGKEFIKLSSQALRRAANAGELEEIKVLLSNCGAINIINEKDENPEKGLTALHYAILKNKPAIVIYLLQEGARTDIPGTKIGTAAELIAASESPEIRSLNTSVLAQALGTGNST